MHFISSKHKLIIFFVCAHVYICLFLLKFIGHFYFSGYMSPEYAMNGVVSIKIDVFSFGVLLLEIISGKKNNSRYHFEDPLNLIGYVSSQLTLLNQYMDF